MNHVFDAPSTIASAGLRTSPILSEPSSAIANRPGAVLLDLHISKYLNVHAEESRWAYGWTGYRRASSTYLHFSHSYGNELK